MNQDNNPTSASAIPAPKTLQIQSNEIEQLAGAIANRPENLNRSHRFAMIEKGKPIWRFALPFPDQQWAGRYAIDQSGTLYSCEAISPNFEKHRWAIASQGLIKAIQQEPHTYGFQMMDAEMIAEHMADTCRKWLHCNFPANLAAEASRILSRDLAEKIIHQDKSKMPANLAAEAGRILSRDLAEKIIHQDKSKNGGEDVDCIALINQCIGFIQDSAVVLDTSLKRSPRTAIRAESVAMIRKGAVQALMASVALLEQSAALCWDADKSPPEGTERASSS